MLSRWRYKVVAHAEGGRRAAFDQDVEEQQNGMVFEFQALTGAAAHHRLSMLQNVTAGKGLYQ